MSQPWLLEAVGSAEWTGTPLGHELVVRAADAAGAQPVEQPCNRQGTADDLVQRVPVTVLQ